MDTKDIESFITIVELGSISAAAKSLFISQSTLSQRMKNLEVELGYLLLEREQGTRKLQLTERGQQFYLIAHEMNSLYKDICSLKNNQNQFHLTIGAVDSINTYSFYPLYQRILNCEQNMHLSIHTFHSNEIYDLVAANIFDVGFVFNKNYSKNVYMKKIFAEPMVLVCNKASNYHDSYKVSDLQRSNEIFLRWNNDFTLWHHQHFDENIKPYVTVNTGSILVNYLTNNEQLYSIAPLSVVQSFSTNKDLTYYHLTPAPPMQVCYKLTPKYPVPSREKSMDLFDKYLKEFLIQKNGIDFENHL